MTEVEVLLRRLALNDEALLANVLVGATDRAPCARLKPEVESLVRLAALIALGAATASLRRAAEHALEGGASDADIAGVLVAVAPVVGQARVVASAPKLATAMGFPQAADER